MKIKIYLIEAVLISTMFLSCSDTGAGFQANDTSSSGGKAGSLSRFTIVDDYLYVAGSNSVETFDISNPSEIKSVHKLTINANTETIIYNNGHLFLGADNGLTILSILQPERPQYVGRYAHALGCDPVVVRDRYAYVTVRNGSVCRRGTVNINTLEVVDIGNIRNPFRRKSFNMTFPVGLDVDKDAVYVCDQEGLKIFDLNDGVNLTLNSTLTDIKGIEVIVLNKHLMSIGATGLVQYDITDLNTIVKLSEIKLEL